MKSVKAVLVVFGCLLVLSSALSQSAKAQSQFQKKRYQKTTGPSFEIFSGEPEALTKARRLLQKEKKPALALTYFNQAVEATNKPRYLAIAHNGRCASLIELKRYKKALEACDTAMEIAPRRWQIYNNKGTAYFYLGRLRFAINTYEKGREFAPKNKTLKENLKLAQTRLDTLIGG